ncbi:hypothetical protein K9O30_09895 [Clostridium bowmanii]|uniref:hypothetical protein n=1 Tax=Clostridium bowmanii TaxID=132925 RepID=UPI001C0B7099|nr:hypothetical protein [Clostridium bowmanii]MBU3189411.1 hypothetical protein [Clostridium bowmanii]MCA1074025.1 hypothetical protein [Clostridium bowmanii]
MKRVFMIVLITFCFVLVAACGNKFSNNNLNSKETTNKETALQKNDSGEDNPKDKAEGVKVATPNVQADINSFIPKGWHILEKVMGQPEKVEGDLNKDGINDVVIVIEGTNKMEGEAAPRSLMILLGNKEKSYSTSVIAEKAVLLSNEGGVWGDPYESIVIDRGSILLNFYGGSNYRWFSSYRFRFQNNGWFLIGVTVGEYYTGTTTKDNADIEDYNLLTGDYVFKKADANGKLILTKGNRGKKDLVNLKNFIANSEEKQY